MMMDTNSRFSVRSLALFLLASAAVIGVGIGAAYMIRPMVVAETTGSIPGGACAAKLPSNFSPRIYEHCVSACMSCDHGTPVTCSTSCKLRGAT